jgi:hypothetical protein
MALLAESLVEEWLNRSGFFTIRGVKHGVGEMDLLAVQHQQGGIIGRHVEVAVSFRPIGYISKQTNELAGGSGRRRSLVKKRTQGEMEICAREWVEHKFRAPEKARLRNDLWPGVEWSFHFVHAALRYPQELEVLKNEGVVCHSFKEVLASLCERKGHSFSGSAGGDIAEIVNYYKSTP